MSIISLVVSAVLCVAPVDTAPHYEVLRLPAVPAYTDLVAVDINNNGIVLGSARFFVGGAQHTVMYDIEAARIWPAIIGPTDSDVIFAKPTALNNTEAVGYAAVEGWGVVGMKIDLEEGCTIMFSPSIKDECLDVNNEGDLCGATFDPALGNMAPVIFGPVGGCGGGGGGGGGVASWQQLPLPSFADYGFANQINNLGVVAGTVGTHNGFTQGVVWYQEVMEFIPITNSVVVGMNKSGVVVGYTDPTIPTIDSFTFSAGEVVMIPKLPGAINAIATDINYDGLVTGYSSMGNGQVHAWLYGPEFGILDLTAIAYAYDGSAVRCAWGLNDNNDIVLNGFYGDQSTLFVMKAVYEPYVPVHTPEVSVPETVSVD